MKKLYILLFVFVLFSCEKYIPFDCGKDNFGYIEVTGKYQWCALQLESDTGLNYTYIWLGGVQTKDIRMSPGRYIVSHAIPYFKNDHERELMLAGSFQPIPTNWNELKAMIEIKQCETTKLNLIYVQH